MSKHQRFLNINFFQLLSSDPGPIDRISWISDALACKASKVCCHKSARPGWCQRRELQKRTWHRLGMLMLTCTACTFSSFLVLCFTLRPYMIHVLYKFQNQPISPDSPILSFLARALQPATCHALTVASEALDKEIQLCNSMVWSEQSCKSSEARTSETSVDTHTQEKKHGNKDFIFMFSRYFMIFHPGRLQSFSCLESCNSTREIVGFHALVWMGDQQ